MIKKIINILVVFLVSSSALKGQNVPNQTQPLPGKIAIKIGYSHYAIKDEFISKEKYSGNVPSFGIEWLKCHEANQFHLGLDFVNSAALQNFNVSATTTLFNMALAFVYPLGRTRLFNKQLDFLLGPAPEISIYYRTQNIARGGTAIFDAYSVAALLALACRLNVIYPVYERFNLEIFLQSSLVSLGGKFIDPRDEHSSPIKILTFAKGADLKFDTSARYDLSKRIAIKGGYRFNLYRIDAWDYLIIVSDNVYLSIVLSI